ncbi:hypothetical protein ACSSS7_006697 [Eimeria intestinalis]
MESFLDEKLWASGITATVDGTGADQRDTGTEIPLIEETTEEEEKKDPLDRSTSEAEELVQGEHQGDARVPAAEEAEEVGIAGSNLCEMMSEGKPIKEEVIEERESRSRTLTRATGGETATSMSSKDPSVLPYRSGRQAKMRRTEAGNSARLPPTEEELPATKVPEGFNLEKDSIEDMTVDGA